MAVYLKTPLLIGSESVNASQKGRFAGTAPSYQSIYFAVFYGQIDIFKYRSAGVFPDFFQILYFNQCFVLTIPALLSSLFSRYTRSCRPGYAQLHSRTVYPLLLPAGFPYCYEVLFFPILPLLFSSTLKEKRRQCRNQNPDIASRVSGQRLCH